MDKRDKVYCETCVYESMRRCSKKRSKINPTKLRRCELYKEDPAKLQIFIENYNRKLDEYPQSIKRPDGFWDLKRHGRTEAGMIVDANTAGVRSVSKTMSVPNKPMISVGANTGDPKYPLSGDLSKFVKSTVADVEE